MALISRVSLVNFYGLVTANIRRKAIFGPGDCLFKASCYIIFQLSEHLLPFSSPTVAPSEMTPLPTGAPKTIHTVKETTSIKEPRPTKEGEKRHQSGKSGGKG